MVLGISAGRVADGPPAMADEVIWHQLECGCYRADLPLWRELADAAGGPILDVGAGSGRVALELAAAGHAVTALDQSAVLLQELDRQAGEMSVPTACTDARAFALQRRDYALCIVPMQTIQLLGGEDGRLAFLRCARAHLRPGGVFACAIVCELEPFDCADGGPAPSAESIEVGDALYVSRAMRIAQRRDSFVIERRRQIVPAHRRGAHGQADRPTRGPGIERDVIELDRVSAAQLEDEARRAGLQVDAAREIASTDEHVGSVVVIAHA